MAPSDGPTPHPVGRPTCAKGHAGDVWLDGFYAKGSTFERPRFIAGEADEFRYRAAIRGSLLVSAGRPAAARRRLDDSGPPSLHEAVGWVARKRRQNRRHARASWWRKRA